MEYTISVNPLNGLRTIVATSKDVVMSFPEDESNADYQAYLAYLAEQETAK